VFTDLPAGRGNLAKDAGGLTVIFDVGQGSEANQIAVVDDHLLSLHGVPAAGQSPRPAGRSSIPLPGCRRGFLELMWNSLASSSKNFVFGFDLENLVTRLDHYPTGPRWVVDRVGRLGVEDAGEQTDHGPGGEEFPLLRTRRGGELLEQVLVRRPEHVVADP